MEERPGGVHELCTTLAPLIRMWSKKECRVVAPRKFLIPPFHSAGGLDTETIIQRSNCASRRILLYKKYLRCQSQVQTGILLTLLPTGNPLVNLVAPNLYITP